MIYCRTGITIYRYESLFLARKRQGASPLFTQSSASLLSAIAADGPGVSEKDVRAIAMPTLVIGHKIDLIHPLEYARTLASTIAGSQLVEITPKATDKPKHVAEFRKAVAQFLGTISKGNMT